jgi:preprotein translocase subunit SecA
MNAQREVIYSKRRQALYGERLALDISNMIYDLCENYVSDYQDNGDFEGFTFELLTTFAAECPFDEKEFSSGNKTKLTDQLFDHIYKSYRSKAKHIAELAYPVIKDVYENHPRYQFIAIPITDGIKTMQVAPNLKRAYDDKGMEVSLAIEKGITLGIIDDAWKEHLREMDELRQSVQSASYEQKDPLLIYKLESFNLFKTMLQKVNKDIIGFLSRANLPVQQADQVKEAHQQRTDTSRLRTDRNDVLSQRTSEPVVTGPVKVEKKVGRNDPCPCGSGKKYKACHGKDEV